MTSFARLSAARFSLALLVSISLPEFSRAQSSLSVPDTFSSRQAETSRPREAMDCAIKPSRIVEISSVLDGVLAEVLVRPGQQVAQGDLIARLDTDIAEAELAHSVARAASTGQLRAAEARAKAARIQYGVQRKGYERKVVSRADFERVRGEYNVARQEVEAQREAIGVADADRQRVQVIFDKGEIRAPFAGIIGEDLLDPSEATEGRPVAHLIVTQPMRVEVFARLDVAEEIRAGADYVILAGATSPEMVVPELDYISPVADPSSQTIRVYYVLESARLSPGFRCLFMKRAAAREFLAGQ